MSTPTNKIDETKKTVHKAKTVKLDKTDKTAKTAKIVNPEMTAKTIKTDQPIKPEKITQTAKLVKPDKVDVIAKSDKAPKTAKLDMTNLKRLPKSQRTYQRRMKQIAHQEGTTFRSLIVRHNLAKKMVNDLKRGDTTK